MTAADRYVRRTRGPGPASWFDVRDGYAAGWRDALLTAADWLENKQPGPDGLLDVAELVDVLRSQADGKVGS